MKKKLIIMSVFVALVLCLFASGCTVNEEKETDISTDKKTKELLVSKGYDYKNQQILTTILVDKDTGVMYLLADNINNDAAGLTPLYNPDGTLKIYDPATCRYVKVYMF